MVVNRLVDKYHLDKLNASCYRRIPVCSDSDAYFGRSQLSGAINPDVCRIIPND